MTGFVEPVIVLILKLAHSVSLGIKVIILNAMTSTPVTTLGKAGRFSTCAYSTHHQARHEKI